MASSIILFAYKTRDVTCSDQASNMLMLRCFHPLMSLYKLRNMRLPKKKDRNALHIFAHVL